MAVFTQRADRHQPEQIVSLFHLSSKQPIRMISQRSQDPYYSVRCDWSPGDSSHLAICWSRGLALTVHVAMLSRDAAATCQVRISPASLCHLMDVHQV